MTLSFTFLCSQISSMFCILKSISFSLRISMLFLNADKTSWTSEVFKEIKIQHLSTIFYFLRKSLTWEVGYQGRKLNAISTILIRSITQRWYAFTQFSTWQNASIYINILIGLQWLPINYFSDESDEEWEPIDLPAVIVSRELELLNLPQSKLGLSNSFCER